MRYNNKIIAGLVVTTLAGVGMAFSAQAAQTNTYPDFVTNIAEKFNLDPAAVDEVVKETREAKQDDRLNEMVEDGKITAEQRQKIEEHRDMMQAKHAELRDQGLSREEIREQLKPLHDEFKAWAEQEGIDDVMPMGKMGKRGGREMHGVDME